MTRKSILESVEELLKSDTYNYKYRLVFVTIESRYMDLLLESVGGFVEIGYIIFVSTSICFYREPLFEFDTRVCGEIC